MSIRWLLFLVLLLIGPTCCAAADDFDWSHARELAPGIQLHTDTRTAGVAVCRYVVRVDLQQPGLRLTTTGRLPDWEKNVRETRRQTVRSFMRSERQASRPVILAFNADAFTPWPAPFDQETESDLRGLAVCRGELVSPGSDSPSFVLDRRGRASIRVTPKSTDVEQIELAVSGFAFCLKDGVVQKSGEDLHPRTGLGLSADGRWMLVLVVDGRRHSSQGATTAELGTWLREFGAYDAINMDGGGSSTLAWWNPAGSEEDKTELLNRPVGNGLKLLTPDADRVGISERANGNNVGVYLLAP